jgi:hypothetical protein
LAKSIGWFVAYLVEGLSDVRLECPSLEKVIHQLEIRAHLGHPCPPLGLKVQIEKVEGMNSQLRDELRHARQDLFSMHWWIISSFFLCESVDYTERFFLGLRISTRNALREREGVVAVGVNGLSWAGVGGSDGFLSSALENKEMVRLRLQRILGVEGSSIAPDVVPRLVTLIHQLLDVRCRFFSISIEYEHRSTLQIRRKIKLK